MNKYLLIFIPFLLTSPVINAEPNTAGCSDEPIGKGAHMIYSRGKVIYYKKGSWDESKRFRPFTSTMISMEKGCQKANSYADCKLNKFRWTYADPWTKMVPGTKGEGILRYVCS